MQVHCRHNSTVSMDTNRILTPPAITHPHHLLHPEAPIVSLSWFSLSLSLTMLSQVKHGNVPLLWCQDRRSKTSSEVGSKSVGSKHIPLPGVSLVSVIKCKTWKKDNCWTNSIEILNSCQSQKWNIVLIQCFVHAEPLFTNTFYQWNNFYNVKKQLYNNADFGHCALTKGFIKFWPCSANKCLQTSQSQGDKHFIFTM